jgi:hypothetical protein
MEITLICKKTLRVKKINHVSLSSWQLTWRICAGSLILNEWWRRKTWKRFKSRELLFLSLRTVYGKKVSMRVSVMNDLIPHPNQKNLSFSQSEAGRRTKRTHSLPILSMCIGIYSYNRLGERMKARFKLIFVLSKIEVIKRLRLFSSLTHIRSSVQSVCFSLRYIIWRAPAPPK